MRKKSSKKKTSISEIFFGFMVAFGMVMAYFMFELILKTFIKISQRIPSWISIVAPILIYIALL